MKNRVAYKKKNVYLFYAGETEDRDKITVPYALDYWLKKGFPAKKIALGMATYARGFLLESSRHHGLGAEKDDDGASPKGRKVISSTGLKIAALD